MKTQRIAFTWACKTYGAIAGQARYQAFRFIEECLELVQVIGLTREDVLRVVDHVFDREPGALQVEVGDARLCLDILSQAVGLDGDEMYENCIVRVLELDPEKLRQKDQMKIAKGLI